MYDNPSTSHLYKHPRPSRTLRTPTKTPDTVRPTPPQSDNVDMLNRDERVAMMTPNCEPIPVSPQPLIITPPRPTSPTSSDADSEPWDDASTSPCSFGGEECPDLCGGPKYACRSWTPPPSPFYYTHASGIFLLDDRESYEERQKIELEHTLHDLNARLQRLRDTMSPPRFLARVHEFGNSTPSPPGGKGQGSIKRCPPSPTEGLADHARVRTFPSGPCPCDCDGTLVSSKLAPTQNASAGSPEHPIKIQEGTETGTADLGKLIHSSLQYVQSTNSPPRYLARVSEHGAEPPLRGAIPILKSHREARNEALLTRHASPQPQPHLHLGDTAYPTPRPSSPETKPSRRKRGRDEDSQESGGRRRRREGG